MRGYVLAAAKFLTLLAFSAPCPKAAAAKTTKLHLQIKVEIAKDALPEMKNGKRQSAKGLCRLWASKLALGKAEFGWGIFESFECSHNGRRMGGRRGPKHWQLTIKVADEGITIDLLHNGKPLSSQPLPLSDRTIKLLWDKDFVSVAALQLLDRSPVGFKLTKKNFDYSTFVIKGGYSGQLQRKILPPENLKLYTIKIDPKKGTLQAQIIGSAVLLTSVEPIGSPGDKKDKEKKKSKEPKKKNLEWQASFNAQVDPEKTVIWGHSSTPGLISSLIPAFLEEAFEIVTEVLHPLQRFGRVQLTYGFPLLSGDPLAEKLTRIGLSASYSGVFSGFKGDFDLWPTVEADFNSQKISFSGYRFRGGWSFMFIPGFLDLVVRGIPRVGWWNVSSRIPLGTSTVVSDFNVSNNFSLGLGLEVGYPLGPFSGFGFFGIDVGNLGLQEQTVFALDWGGEVLWQIMEISKTKLTVSGFFVAEKFTYVDSSVTSAGLAGGVNVFQTFMGLGLGVTW